MALKGLNDLGCAGLWGDRDGGIMVRAMMAVRWG